MLFVWIFLLVGTFFLIALVDFVLRNPMFAETFVIKLGIPFTKIELVKENVEFIYIIAGSMFLGAFIIALSTWVLDARRKFKVRSLQKELKRLEKEVKEARASLPESPDTAAVDIGTTETEEQPADSAVASAVSPEVEAMSSDFSEASPEEITKSFEDVVEESSVVADSEQDESDRVQKEQFVPEDDETDNVVAGQTALEDDEPDSVSVELAVSEEEPAEELSEEAQSEVTTLEEPAEELSEEAQSEVSAMEAELVEPDEALTEEGRKEKDEKGSEGC
jgi:hypothetical protein